MPTVQVPRFDTPFRPPDTRVEDASPAIRQLVGTLQNVASIFADVDAQRVAARRASKASEVILSGARFLADQEELTRRDADYETLPKRFEEGAGFKAFAATLPEDIDPAMRAQIQQKYEPLFLNSLIRVREDAWKRETADFTAGLNAHEQQYLVAASDMTDPARAAIAQQGYTDEVNAAVQAGMLYPNEAQARFQKFGENLESMQIDRAILANPLEAFKALSQPQDITSQLTPLQYGQKREKALNEHFQQIGRQQSADSAERAAYEFNKKQRGDLLQRQVFEMRMSNQLTPDFVEANKRDFHTAEDYAAAQHLAREFGAIEDSPADLVQLHEALGNSDISQLLSRMVRANRITAATYGAMMNQNRALLDEVGTPGKYKRALSIIKNGLDPAQLDFGGSRLMLTAARTDALEDYYNWADAHSDASTEEFIAKAREIKNQYAVLKTEEMAMAIGKPYGVEKSYGELTPEDMDASRKAIDIAREAGKLSIQEANREKVRIGQHLEILRLRSESMAAKQPAVKK